MEVLIALVVFSIGLLGLAGLQVAGLRYNHSAYLRSQAATLAYDMLDRMRANRSQAVAGNYALAFASSPPSGSDVASSDLTQWVGLLAGTLPTGDGEIASGLTNGRLVFRVTVQWDDTRGEAAPQQFVLRTEI